MMEKSQTELIEDVLARFIEPKIGGTLEPAFPYFDVSKPNIHDSKAEFIAEKKAVEAAILAADELVAFFYAAIIDDAENHEMLSRVTEFIDAEVRKKKPKAFPKSAFDLIRSNNRNIGISNAAIFVVADVAQGLQSRKQELVSQESIFWTSPNRAPNHYARTIALRFAKLIAKHTGKKPTFGTSSAGSHPSTEFGRGLEDIFAILEINAHVKNAAKWAIAQLKDDDLVPTRSAPTGHTQQSYAGLMDQLSNDPEMKSVLAVQKMKLARKKGL